MNFLKNKDLDKNFIFAVNDTPQPQQMIFSSGLFIESYKSMVGPGYEVALVRFNKEEIRKEIIKFDGVFNKKSTVYLNKKLTYNLKQREKLREELINILDNQYKYVDLQLKKSINDNIRKFKNVISSPSSKEKGKMIKNKGKIISSKIDDKIFFNNNVKKKFNKYLRYFTGKIKKKLKLDDVYFFIQQQVEGYEFYNPYDNQLRRLPIKNLFINLGHPLIKYFQKTRDILILEEISFFKEENFANLSNKSWLKICTLLKKYSFTVAAPIYYSDQIIGIIFLGKRIKNRLYTIEEINKLKKSINDSCSYLWEFLSYYWAVLSLKR